MKKNDGVCEITPHTAKEGATDVGSGLLRLRKRHASVVCEAESDEKYIRLFRLEREIAKAEASDHRKKFQPADSTGFMEFVD